jgi:hypothetical protein
VSAFAVTWLIARIAPLGRAARTYRVHPTELADGAHAGSGKFRLDASAGEKAIFQVAFDGTHSYDQDGPLPPERAMSDEMSAFGFSAIHFALQPGRVRHFYDGVKSVDIRWTSAEIGTPIPDSTFVLGPGPVR